MALPLPNLDDRTYPDLMEEVRALIPSLYRDWTDHNPTDPGITLIELFAALTEMLIYRTNQVPEQHLVAFLNLLNGPDWGPGPDLNEDIRSSVVNLRKRYRAVTCEDYEALTLEASPDIARVKCIQQRYLGAGTEAERRVARPGHISLIVVPNVDDSAAQPSSELRQTVWDYLDPRRVLTTRHHVVGPIYAPVSAGILIASRPDITDVVSAPGRPTAVEELRNQVVDKLETFLHPLKGGSDGAGWPFGRGIYVSELYQLLEAIPGVDYVPDISLSSQCPPQAPRCVAAQELWHDEGDLIGLELAAHHLPQAQIDPNRIVVWAVFVPVSITIQATPMEAVSLAQARRAVKSAVKQLFHPFYDGPAREWRTASWEVTQVSIATVVRQLPEIDETEAISVMLPRDPLSFEARKLADVQVTVELG